MDRAAQALRKAGLTFAAIALICTPTAASASPAVRLSARFTPNLLGHSAAIDFGFRIAERTGEVPPPLTEVDLRYPGELGIATSGLGIATCSSATIEALGPAGCAADSVMGYGSAVTAIPYGTQVFEEPSKVTIVRGPDEEGHLAFLLHATGKDPIISQLTFPALLLPSSAPFGEMLRARIPLIPTFPGEPDAAVIRMHATLGPPGVIYNERVGKRIVTYHPPGILLPDRCPRGGFPFAARLGFLDGHHAVAHTVVPCPPAHHGRGSAKG